MTLGYINVTNHPLTKDLESNFHKIREEFENLRKVFGTSKKTNNYMGNYQQESAGKILYEGKIQSLFTRVAEDSCSEPEYKIAYGSSDTSKKLALERYKLRQRMTPVLENILKRYEEKNQLGTVGFNIISEPSKLNLHYGMTTRYVRFHLCLYGDSTSTFFIKDESPRSWSPGNIWAFNDGLAFHGTVHESYNERVILIVDLTTDAL